MQHFLRRAAVPGDDPRIFQPDGERCAGGPLGLLDLAGVRDQQAVQAAELHDAWTRATASMPPARTLAEFAAHHGDRTDALLAFGAQPQIKSLTDVVGAGMAYRWRTDGPALAALDREQFIARARRLAVPGQSLLDLHGGWRTDPGWLNDDDPAESGSAVYHDYVNACLDALPEDHVVLGLEFRR